MDLQANRIINTFTDSASDHAEGDQTGVRDPQEYGIHLAPLEKASQLATWGLSVISEEGDTCLSEEKSTPFHVSKTGKNYFTRGMCQSLAMDFEGTRRVHPIYRNPEDRVRVCPVCTWIYVPDSANQLSRDPTERKKSASPSVASAWNCWFICTKCNSLIHQPTALLSSFHSKLIAVPMRITCEQPPHPPLRL